MQGANETRLRRKRRRRRQADRWRASSHKCTMQGARQVSARSLNRKSHIQHDDIARKSRQTPRRATRCHEAERLAKQRTGCCIQLQASPWTVWAGRAATRNMLTQTVSQNAHDRVRSTTRPRTAADAVRAPALCALQPSAHGTPRAAPLRSVGRAQPGSSQSPAPQWTRARGGWDQIPPSCRQTTPCPAHRRARAGPYRARDMPPPVGHCVFVRARTRAQSNTAVMAARASSIRDRACAEPALRRATRSLCAPC